MIITDTLPCSGQFVAIHSFDQASWGQTLRWNDDGGLEVYDETSDKFSPCHYTKFANAKKGEYIFVSL